MKYYEDFLKLGCFRFDDAMSVVGNDATTKSILQQYTKKGYIVKIKRGLYAAVNLLDREPVANKFVIASKLTDTAVVSHHSAFEYYGYTNQVSYDVTVTSESKFNPFEFGGFRYRRMTPHMSIGVVKNTSGISVTDVERTVVDAIDSFENDMGLEELLRCIAAIPTLNEEKLLRYLSAYDKCFLYQKAGYLLEQLRGEFDFSEAFFSECKQHAGNSSRYLLRDMPKDNISFSSRWHLTLPRNMRDIITAGGDEDAYV